MFKRLKAWWNQVVHRLRRKWWALVIFLIYGAMEHWFFGTINDFLAAHKGPVLDLVHPLFNYRKGIGLSGTAGVILIAFVIVHSYFDTRPRVKPQLAIASYAATSGLYS